MKRWPWVFFLAATLTACAGGGDTEKRPVNIPAIPATPKPTGIKGIRLTALKETAATFGAQGGLAWRASQINDLLTQRQKKLDQVFNFNAMLLPHSVLPPVLVEARGTLNLDTSSSLRLADTTYSILSPARFITAPPTWRDYLWLAFRQPQPPDATLLPQNAQELTVWNEYVKKGWQAGVDQANTIFSANLSRLKRDLAGMALYRELYAQNMVSAPFVAKADLGITGKGDELRINDQVLRITATSQFKRDSQTWNPAVMKD